MEYITRKRCARSDVISIKYHIRTIIYLQLASRIVLCPSWHLSITNFDITTNEKIWEIAISGIPWIQHLHWLRHYHVTQANCKNYLQYFYSCVVYMWQSMIDFTIYFIAELKYYEICSWNSTECFFLNFYC